MTGQVTCLLLVAVSRLLRAAEEKAKDKARLKQQSEAKKAAKLEKKAQKKAPSAFMRQEEQARQAAAERAVGVERAKP